MNNLDAFIRCHLTLSLDTFIVLVKPGINYILIWYIDIASGVFKVDGTNVRVGRVENALFVLQASLLRRLGETLLLSLELRLLLFDRLL